MKIDSYVNVTRVQLNSGTDTGNYNQGVSTELTKQSSLQSSEQNDINRISENLLKKSIEKSNEKLENINRKVERHIHEKTNTLIFKIVDTETDEVIKEFPPEKIQDMIAKMWEMVGLFVDEKA